MWGILAMARVRIPTVAPWGYGLRRLRPSKTAPPTPSVRASQRQGDVPEDAPPATSQPEW
jgi:hypothetical protein